MSVPTWESALVMRLTCLCHLKRVPGVSQPLCGDAPRKKVSQSSRLVNPRFYISG
ncbi:hypothetical protein Plhal304r1_c003g0012161 [Plasmopara halstedii]